MNLSNHTRKLRFAAPAGIAALVVVLVMTIGPVFAAGLTGSDFDSGDGNLTVEGLNPLDWANVADIKQQDKPTGTTNMDFEFNQSSTLSGNGVTPVRTTGDVLVAYDLSQGGTVPTISVHFWDGCTTRPASFGQVWFFRHLR